MEVYPATSQLGYLERGSPWGIVSGNTAISFVDIANYQESSKTTLSARSSELSAKIDGSNVTLMLPIENINGRKCATLVADFQIQVDGERLLLVRNSEIRLKPTANIDKETEVELMAVEPAIKKDFTRKVIVVDLETVKELGSGVGITVSSLRIIQSDKAGLIGLGVN
ncbi:hypothetical protein ACFL2H_10825 [Planctomycetota bacterium]